MRRDDTRTPTVPLSTNKLPSAQPSNRSVELLAGLEDIVLAEGFARLSVSEIAARLSCSKRTLYEIAPSKNDLVLGVLRHFFSEIRREANLARDGRSDPAERIYVYLQAGVRAAERLSPAAVADIHRWPPARRIWQDHVRLRVEGLRRIIEEGIEAGTFRRLSPAFVAEIVFASINRLREPDFYRATDLTISEAFNELYDMLLAALARSDA